MAIPTASNFPLKQAPFLFRRAYGTAEDILASSEESADADRIRNCDFETPLLHRRGLHWQEVRTRCSATGLVPTLPAGLASDLQFVGNLPGSTRDYVHEVHRDSKRQGDFCRQHPGRDRT